MTFWVSFDRPSPRCGRVFSFTVVTAFVVLCPIALFTLFLQTFDERAVITPTSTVSDLTAQQKTNPRFSKVVFMVIDAFRDSFMFERDSPMTNVKRLLSEGKAKPYSVNVQAPTVTMPRIKTMMLGYNPSFFDLIRNNFKYGDGSHGPFEDYDSIISQLKGQNRRAVFYGDDVWFSIFGSNAFLRSEGTTSLFVNDHVYVDLNVTRNVRHELETRTRLKDIDWDLGVFHYLGVDHIGHKFGPFASLMTEKLKEMDDVIEEIYVKLTELEKAEKEQNPDALPFLFMVLGDHGMTDDGQHGGTKHSESSAGLVFISNAFGLDGSTGLAYEPKTIEQSSICATLANAFGVDIPVNNVGAIVREVLEFKNPRFANEPVRKSLDRIHNNVVQAKLILKYQEIFNDQLEDEYETVENLYSEIENDKDATKEQIEQAYLAAENLAHSMLETSITSPLIPKSSKLFQNSIFGFIVIGVILISSTYLILTIFRWSIFEKPFTPNKTVHPKFVIPTFSILVALFAIFSSCSQTLVNFNTLIYVAVIIITSLLCSLVVVICAFYANHLLLFLLPKGLIALGSFSEQLLSSKIEMDVLENQTNDIKSVNEDENLDGILIEKEKETLENQESHENDDTIEAEKEIDATEYGIVNLERKKIIIIVLCYLAVLIVQPFLGFRHGYIIEEEDTWSFLLFVLTYGTVFVKIVYNSDFVELLLNVSLLVIIHVIVLWNSVSKSLSSSFLTFLGLVSFSIFILLIFLYLKWYCNKQFTTTIRMIIFALFAAQYLLSFLLLFFPNVFISDAARSAFRLIGYGSTVFFVILTFIWPLFSLKGIRGEACQLHIFFGFPLFGVFSSLLLIQRRYNIPLFCLWFLFGIVYVFITARENKNLVKFAQNKYSMLYSSTFLLRSFSRIAYLWIVGRAAFFSCGNTNSVAKLDFTLAYEGMTSFIPIVIFPLAFLSIYALPIVFGFFSQIVIIMESDYHLQPVQQTYEKTAHSVSIFVCFRAILQTFFSMTIAVCFHHNYPHWIDFASKYCFDNFEVILSLISALIICCVSTFLYLFKTS